ncbi:YdaU family protein [Coralloluteibacterium thermophilus]|uniref:YdaU family protein n=1 Tax=Coralloluteibacterium thermophilum TaxID=2707049 RepID=A0ABV9NMB4_9GAMM
MNYYERHLGDYARDTGHLTPLEHGVYTLLLDRYYATEQGIPEDQAHRVCRARSKDEKEAVDAVLSEFFKLVDGVWTNPRADREIEKFRESEPEREAKRENAKERQRRFRERRAAMFETLREHGIVPSYDASMTELETLVKRVTSRDVTQDVTRYETTTQTPDTRHHQDQEQSSLRSDSSAPLALTPEPADLKAKKRARIQQIAEDAQAAYNATLGKPNGLLPACAVLNKPRLRAVERCLPTARAICQAQYGSERITADFWADYFATAARDDFHAGRLPGGRGHENWKPDFEFLLREDVMAKLFDRAMSEDAA